jgi:hypothetical protein
VVLHQRVSSRAMTATHRQRTERSEKVCSRHAQAFGKLALPWRPTRSNRFSALLTRLTENRAARWPRGLLLKARTPRPLEHCRRWLLRPRHYRPCRRAFQPRDEFAPPHLRLQNVAATYRDAGPIGTGINVAGRNGLRPCRHFPVAVSCLLQRRRARRRMAMPRRLLVSVGKLYQLRFTPGASEQASSPRSRATLGRGRNLL